MREMTQSVELESMIISKCNDINGKSMKANGVVMWNEILYVMANTMA